MNTSLSDQISGFFATHYPEAQPPELEHQKELSFLFADCTLKRMGHIWFQNTLPENMLPLGNQALLRKSIAVRLDMMERLQKTKSAGLREVHQQATEAFDNELSTHHKTPTTWLTQAIHDHDEKAIFTLLDHIDCFNVLVFLDAEIATDWFKTRDAQTRSTDQQWLNGTLSSYLTNRPETLETLTPNDSRQDYFRSPLRLAVSAFMLQSLICMRQMKVLVPYTQINWNEFKAGMNDIAIDQDTRASLVKNCLLINSTGTSYSFCSKLYTELPMAASKDPVDRVLNDLFTSGDLAHFLSRSLKLAPTATVAHSAGVFQLNRIESLLVNGERITRQMKSLVDLNGPVVQHNEALHDCLKHLMVSHFINGNGGSKKLYSEKGVYRAVMKPAAQERQPEDTQHGWQDTIKLNRYDSAVLRQDVKNAMSMAAFPFQWYPKDRWQQDPQWHRRIEFNGQSTTWLTTLLTHYADKLGAVHDVLSYVHAPKGNRRGTHTPLMPVSKVPFDVYLPTLGELSLIQSRHDPSWLSTHRDVLINCIRARFSPCLPPRLTSQEKKAWIEVLEIANHQAPDAAASIWLSLLSQPTVPDNYTALLRWGRTLGMTAHEITARVQQARESIDRNLITASHEAFEVKMAVRIEKMMANRSKCSARSLGPKASTHLEVEYEGL